MDDYRDAMRGYEHDAEEYYDDYDGQYEDEFDAGFEGNDDADYYDDYDDEMEYVEYPEEYSDYAASSIGTIDPNDRTLTVVINNTGTTPQTAILFGGNESAPQHQNIEVRVEESSHQEVREESKSAPFKIVGMKMSVSDELQFDHILKITRRSSTGSNTARVYQPRNATSPQNLNSKLIDDNSATFEISGQDRIRFTQRPGTTVFTFTVKARANITNLLRGRNVAEMSTVPRTTGLPQMDIARQPEPGVFGMRPTRPRRSKPRRVAAVRRRRPMPVRGRKNKRR